MELSTKHKSEKSFFDELAKERKDALEIEEVVIRRYMFPSSKPIFAKEYMFHLLGELDGKEILDFGCGEGENSVLLAKKGATVYSFDISFESLRLCKEIAKANNVMEKVHICCMAGEQLAFKDESFDMIFGNTILHHLDVEVGVREIFRILKKGGVAVFKEPIVLSKMLRVLRGLVPIPTHTSPDERQLLNDDLRMLREHFQEVNFTFFRIFGRLERVVGPPITEYRNNKIQNIQIFLIRCLYKLDYFLLKYFPWLSRYAGGVVIQIRK